MWEMIVKWLAEVGYVARVYTEVDFYTYIKVVEYLICIGFFVVYNLFWKSIFKPDHWVKSGRPNTIAGLALLAGFLLAGPVMAASTPAAPAAPAAPATILIDRLVGIYQGVSFDHATHVDLVGDCTACHHHTTGAVPSNPDCARCHAGKGKAQTVSCKGCHSADPFTVSYLEGRPADTYHLDKPGLKGAYHLGCIGCHNEMGGPKGCRECHPVTVEGESFLHLDAKGGKKP